MTSEELNEHSILSEKISQKQTTGAELNRFLALDRRIHAERSTEERMAIAEEFYGEDELIDEDPEEEAERWRVKYEIAVKQLAELNAEEGVK